MDLHLPYALTHAIGHIKLLEYLQIAYPQFGLYSISWSCCESTDYICKAKGIKGDICIMWD